MVRPFLSIPVALLLCWSSLSAAQAEWNAIQSATGWASFDRDGSCNFYEPVSRKLINWSREGGVLGQLDLSKASTAPEMWVVDSGGNAWCITGTTLQHYDKTGHAGSSSTLPAAVGDLSWDTRSFVLCYRSQELYLEKRELKTGSILWSYGVKPPKGEAFGQVLHHVVIQEDGQILVASGNSLDLLAIDGAKGKLVNRTSFSNAGVETPVLALSQQNRGALQWWLGTSFALAAVPASQAPSLKLEGLLLVKEDLAKHTATYLATGLSEDHALVGILENTIVFRSPAGGLAFITLEP